MNFKDYYQILGLKPDADKKAIKTAYRKLARKYHPDVSTEDNAEEKFKEVKEAYNVLKDEEKRADYDYLRKHGRSGDQFDPPPNWNSGRTYQTSDEDFSHNDYSDFFENIFRNANSRNDQYQRYQQRYSQKGEDIESTLPLFLEEAAAGETKMLSLEIPKVDASGHYIKEKKTLKVKIPQGVTDGERIRLKGQGAPGVGGGANGDLYITIQLAPHPLFDVDGRDISVTVPVSPWEAALGTKVTVPTLSGSVNMTIPSDTQTGKRLRIKGKGLSSASQNGDLYVVVKVEMPNDSDEKMKDLWQKMAEHSSFDPRSNWGRE